jgi:hypothetical protein
MPAQQVHQILAGAAEWTVRAVREHGCESIARPALQGRPALQQDYMQHWLGLNRRFDPSRA